MAKQMDRQKQSARKDTAKKTADKACRRQGVRQELRRNKELRLSRKGVPKIGVPFLFQSENSIHMQKIRRQKPPKKSFYDEDFAFVRFEFTGNCRAFAALARPNFAERIFLL